MKKFLLPVLFLALAAGALPAQDASPTPTPDPGTKVALWICNTPGGTYEVALRIIVSVSICEYIVNGTVHVDEVNIDTTGNSSVRFYYLEPVTPNAPDGMGQSAIDKAKELAQQAAQAAGDTTGVDVWKKVIKNYPTSTHAHTIEYRVDSKDDLMTLFKSAEKAVRTATATTLSIGQPSDISPNSNPPNSPDGN